MTTVPYHTEQFSLPSLGFFLRCWLLALLLLIGAPLLAQRKGQAPVSDTWNGTIAVEEDSMLTRNGTFPAWRITLYETDARGALSLWRAEARERGARVGGTRPLVARQVVLPGPLGMPLDVWAMSDQDRATGQATLTFSLIANEMHLPHGREGVEATLRELAVLLNKAVVQEQIDDLHARRKDTRGRIESASKDEEKLLKQLAKADRRMEKITRDQSRAQRNTADQKRRLARLESRAGRNASNRDLRRMGVARRNLARSERRLARLKRDEARTLSDINKLRSALPEKQQEQQQDRDLLNDKARRLEMLQRKHDAIQ